MIKVGDKVKVTDRVAHMLTSSTKQNRYKLDWRTRKGIVMSICKPADQAGVLWDGRKSTDFWPLKALQLDLDQASNVGS